MIQAQEMNDEELRDAYTRGKKFWSDKFQVTDSDKAEDGTKYNHALWLRADKRVAELETEMLKRGLL